MDELTIDITTIRTPLGREVGVLRMTGALSFDTADHARDTLRASGVLDRPAASATDLVVEVGDLSFLDSTGIRILLDLRHRLTAAERFLALAGTNDAVGRTLDITGLTEALPRHPTVDDAAAALDARASGGATG